MPDMRFTCRRSRYPGCCCCYRGGAGCYCLGWISSNGVWRRQMPFHRRLCTAFRWVFARGLEETHDVSCWWWLWSYRGNRDGTSIPRNTHLWTHLWTSAWDDARNRVSNVATAERVELVVGSVALNKQNEMDMDLTKLVMDLNLKIEFRVYSG